MMLYFILNEIILIEYALGRAWRRTTCKNIKYRTPFGPWDIRDQNKSNLVFNDVLVWNNKDIHTLIWKFYKQIKLKTKKILVITERSQQLWAPIFKKKNLYLRLFGGNVSLSWERWLISIYLFLPFFHELINEGSVKKFLVWQILLFS